MLARWLQNLPSAAKAAHFFASSTARLKPCPFKAFPAGLIPYPSRAGRAYDITPSQAQEVFGALMYASANEAVKWTQILKSFRMENRPVFKKQSRKIILKAMLAKFHSAHIDGAFDRQILKMAFSE
jgi:hypothetical protein